MTTPILLDLKGNPFIPRGIFIWFCCFMGVSRLLDVAKNLGPERK